jgi:hypothetical protein
MENSMKTAKCDISGNCNAQPKRIFPRASSSSRVWQSLPRHLRRRAASHDVRRVPVRLREKARYEVRLHYSDSNVDYGD